jgi:hypothetical protein
MTDQQRREIDTHYRRVHGEQALCAAIHNLIDNECWFSITPEPDDMWRINVKSDCVDFLPPGKDWSAASDAELLAFAATQLPDQIVDFNTGETILSDDAAIDGRGDDGFRVTTVTWICYPRDRS